MIQNASRGVAEAPPGVRGEEQDGRGPAGGDLQTGQVAARLDRRAAAGTALHIAAPRRQAVHSVDYSNSRSASLTY